MRNRNNWLIVSMYLALIASACTSAQQDLDTRGTEIAADIFASQTSAPPLENPTQLPTATSPPTATTPPSATPHPIPTQTHRPPPVTPTASPTPGPYVFEDDLSRASPAWLDCDACTFQDGVLHLGPYPAEGAYLQHNVICGPCGAARHFRMAVDASFADGVSDRGFGLLLRMTEEYMLTMEITPWQTVDVWRLDFETGNWEWVNGSFSGLVRPNQQTNRIETDIRPALSGSGMTSDIYIKVNGKTVFVVYNQPAELGLVGLTLFGHSTEVIFHNFEFETEDLVIPIPPDRRDDLQG